ncbi:MAG: carboxypeptidase regulatory-like domain-containing protein [Planctomycetota bacterium]|jgi:hypothetical protein
MTPSRRSAIALAAAAVCGVLWLALTGPARDEVGGAPVRPAAVEAPEERHPAAPELSAVSGEERRRAAAGDTAEPEAPPDEAVAAGVRVHGQVRADATFAPEAVTTVWAHRPGAEEEEEARSVQADPRAPRAWAFEALPPGSWIFTAFVVEGERVAIGSAGPVDVAAGAPPVAIDAMEYSVAGVVTDSDGQPLPEIAVELWWTSSEPHRLPSRHFPPRFAGASEIPELFGGLSGLSRNVSRVGDSQRAMTDGMGRFRFPVAGPGTVELRAPGNDWIGREAITFQLSSGFEGDGVVRIAADTNMTVSFEVNDTASPQVVPPPGEEEQRQRLALSQALVASVLELDSEGEGGPEDGETTWLPSSVEDQLTPAKPRIDDLVLQLHRPASLSGRLRANGGGPEGISCFLRLLTKSAPKGAPRQQQVSTDENGEFTFAGCAAGEYFLYARCGGEAGQDYSLRVALTLGEGEERFIDDRLTPSARINGVVRDREGRPLAGVDVRATGRRNGNLTRRATTDASGMYTLVGLYEGDYVLTLANNRVEKPLIVEVPAGGPVLEADPLVASDI